MQISETRNEGLAFIRLEEEDFSITLSNLGASVYLIKWGNDVLNLTPASVSDYRKAEFYHGKTVGRTGNRIRGNTVRIAGKICHLENNEGLNTLHGGKSGLSSRFFTYVIVPGKETTDVYFDYNSPNGESGYPGNLQLTVKYTVDPKRKTLSVSYTATTDANTLCALTNHLFFSLGEEDLSSAELLIHASDYLETSPVTLLPIGRKEVPSYLDFRKRKPVMKDIDTPVLQNSRHHGYDHHYYFDEIVLSSPQVTLTCPKYQLDIYTDYPGAQIYTDNWPKKAPFIGTSKEKNRGIAIEPQEAYLRHAVLKPGDVYSHFIRYVFTKRKTK